MYSMETRMKALGLVLSGLNPAEASRALGGSPSETCIRDWAAGKRPPGAPRKPPVRFACHEKLAAVRRANSGESVRSVALDVGCAPGTLENWRLAYASRGEAGLMTAHEARDRAKAKALSPGDLPDDPELLKAMVLELQFQADLARELLELVKKDPGADTEALSNREKAELIGALRPAYSLTFLTSRLGISPSTYHRHRRAIEEPRDRDADIRADVIALFEASGGTDGYRRIWRALSEARGGAGPSEKRVRRVMGEEGLVVACRRRRRPRSPRPCAPGERAGLPNLPLRDDGTHDFSAKAPNVLWLTDVTEFGLPGDDRRVYLSAVLDCFDSSIVGWAVALRATSEGLVDPSLKMACLQLRDGDAPVLHSDGGRQYTAKSWREICSDHGIRRSMSRPGTSPDNARMEGFFGTLKNTWFHGRDWSGWTAPELAAEVGSWVMAYNEGRRKESLEWKTPAEYRRRALAEIT